MIPARPLVIAHRGSWGAAPQNSLAALETAIELGCDMVELDVRVTRDRRLAVIHDARAGAGVGTLVSGLTLAELQGRLGRGSAPELEAMVERAAGRIALDVELKVDAAVPAVLDVLARHLTPDDHVVTSFVDGALAAVRALSPQTRTGLLVGPGRRARRLERRLEETEASFVAPHASLARGGLLAWAHERDLETYVWTVNDRWALRALCADPRVAGIITDRPQRALATRAELG